jgi:hypothetical protein
MAFALIVASPFTIGVLAVAIRIARQDFAEYLALRWPSLRELGRAFAMMSALLLVWFLIAHLTGQKSSRFALDGYRIARQTGWLLEYLIALCIVAPITEGAWFAASCFAAGQIPFSALPARSCCRWRCGLDAHAVQSVLPGRRVRLRPAARLSALPLRLDLADPGPSRKPTISPVQSRWR